MKLSIEIRECWVKNPRFLLLNDSCPRTGVHSCGKEMTLFSIFENIFDFRIFKIYCKYGVQNNSVGEHMLWISEKSHEVLALNVWGPSYLSLTRSISWLLMRWLLTSPGHQQPWYWLCRIGRFLSCLRKDLNYLRRINVEKWDKM